MKKQKSQFDAAWRVVAKVGFVPSSPSEPLVTGIRFREGGFRVAQQQSYHKVDKSRVNLDFQFNTKRYYGKI